MENRKKVTVVMSTAARPGDPAWYKQEFPFENKLTEKESLELLPADAAENCILENEIRIFPEKICQEITGFGISLEESTIHNLAKMQPQSRENF